MNTFTVIAYKNMTRKEQEQELSLNTLLTTKRVKPNMKKTERYYDLHIYGEKEDLKKFNKEYVIPDKGDRYGGMDKHEKFLEILRSISKEFKRGRFEYTKSIVKFCRFDEVPVPVDEWLKSLSEFFPNLTFSLTCVSYVQIGYSDGVNYTYRKRWGKNPRFGLSWEM